jgi:hypothetical protein
MATFKKFEDISAWQKSRELTKEIYSVTGQGGFSRDFGLKDQIRRADQDYITQTRSEVMANSATQISRMISGLMSYLRKSGVKGTKFKKPNAKS